MPPRTKKKKVGGLTAFHAAAVAAAASADAAAAPADGAVAPPEPLVGANGVATTRATSLPPLPGFVWDRNMEFRRGRGNGWFVVGISADKPDN